MTGIDKNFYIFKFLLSILIFFQTKSANTSLKADKSMSSIFVERVHHSDSKTIRKVDKGCIKTRMSNFFELFGVILKCF